MERDKGVLWASDVDDWDKQDRPPGSENQAGRELQEIKLQILLSDRPGGPPFWALYDDRRKGHPSREMPD